MLKSITVGLDRAKNVFQMHTADGAERNILCRGVLRTKVVDFFGQPPS